MSAKQEPAQAPATVSPGDSGGQRQAAGTAPAQQQPVSHYQGQVIYQQQPFGTVHYQQPGQQWNQQPPQGTVHYVQYPRQQEYPEKVQSYNHYGTVHYAQPPLDNGEMMMRQPQYVQQQYVTSPQWYQPGQPPQQGQFIPTYANSFNVNNDPAYNTTMNRGHRRHDDFQGGPEPSYAFMQFVPFVAPIGVMESQAHASASYTANWVSSTSSIPPELRDEPEDFQSDNISQYDGQRPSSQQLNGDNWTERDEHFSPSTAHHHSQPPSSSSMRHQYNEKTERNGGAGSSSEMKKSLDKRPIKKEKFDKNDDKRELTFDERLEKARMQKDRVENKRDVIEQSSNPGAPQSSSSQPITPRLNGQKAKHEGYNNNQNQTNTPTTTASSNFTARRYTNHHQSQPVQAPLQPQPSQNNGNNSANVFPVGSGGGGSGGNGENHVPRYAGERVPKRDNNYANRYENPHHNPSSNQPLPHQMAPPPPPQHRPHQMHQHPMSHHLPPTHQPPPSSSNMGPPGPQQYHQNIQNHSYPPREDHFRPPNFRGRGGRGGSYRGHHAPPQNYNQPAYMVPHQMMDQNILATINAFQNLNFPPGVSRLPLLPGPFGMPRQPPPPPPPMQQDIKFQNTWLDARYPMSMPMEQRYQRGGGPVPYRGRGRGGGGGYNGGYRGGYRGGQLQGNNFYNNGGNGYGPSTSTASVYRRDVRSEEKRTEKPVVCKAAEKVVETPDAEKAIENNAESFADVVETEEPVKSTEPLEPEEITEPTEEKKIEVPVDKKSPSPPPSENVKEVIAVETEPVQNPNLETPSDDVAATTP